MGRGERKVGGSSSNFLTMSAVIEKQVIDIVVFHLPFRCHGNRNFLFLHTECQKFNRNLHFLHFYILQTRLGLITNSVYLKGETYVINTEIRKTALPYSDCCSVPFFFAASHLDCTCSLVIELINGAN